MPLAMMEIFTRDYGIEVTHGWGMTEMSPVGTLTLLRAEEKALTPGRARAPRLTAGPAHVRRRSQDHRREGQPRASRRRDLGRAVRARPAIVSGYYNNEEARQKQIDAEGWFATGDVAKITQDGWLHDRRPHQGPREVGRRVDQLHRCGERGARREGHRQLRGDRRAASQWNERPLLVVVKAPAQSRPRPRSWTCSAPRSPSGSSPTTWCSSTPSPMTATGKISKKDLRAKFADHKLAE